MCVTSAGAGMPASQQCVAESAEVAQCWVVNGGQGVLRICHFRAFATIRRGPRKPNVKLAYRRFVVPHCALPSAAIPVLLWGRTWGGHGGEGESKAANQPA
jgi:hypothetical protein